MAKRPEDLLYEFAVSEKVSPPTPSKGVKAVLGKIKCWWEKEHLWLWLRAMGTHDLARMCRRCGRLEQAVKIDGVFWFEKR